MIGKSLGHYQIIEQLGAGGMGAVYKARDSHLERFVALKIMALDKLSDPERKRRFVQEARAASALRHPNIIAIHDIDQADGIDFIAMECVDGQTLKEIIGGKGLPAGEALHYAIQVASALAAAHSAGIVHRDIKPANIMATSSAIEPGQIKVLDFGLAKLTEGATKEADSIADTRTEAPALTREGAIVGTAAYMSPEQVEGRKVDARSDVFSFGALLYEMLAGKPAFQGKNTISTMSAILRDDPPALNALRPDVPPELERIIRRCLEKDPVGRYASGAELYRELSACRAGISASQASAWVLLRNRRVAAAVAAPLLIVIAAGAWFWQRTSQRRWAQDQALPEAARLAELGQYTEASRLASEAERYLPQSAQLAQLWPRISNRISVNTEPADAEISIRPYAETGGNWTLLGRTPLSAVRIPIGYYRWRITRAGFQTVEAAGPLTTDLAWKLDAEDSIPSDMVRVPQSPFRANLAGFGVLGPLPLDTYLIDKFEVTNRQFKQFIDAGGYQQRDYWKHAFLREGRPLSWEDAMGLFRDATNRPGPSTWEAGNYPAGQDDYPVSGVSWHEAAAYAEFAGKSLPTLYHWYQAAGLQSSAYMIPVSNIGKGTGGTTRAGAHQGLGPFGTYDMGGNVREWCWNEEATGGRYILGGAWNQPAYHFNWPEPRGPFDRTPGNGFRCVRYSGTQSPPAAVAGTLRRLFRDFSKETPVSEAEFAIIRRMYAYEPGPLESQIHSTDTANQYWTKTKVSYRAAYGNERVPAYLFLPRNAAPPYQTVVYFPGANAIQVASSENLVALERVQIVLNSGRAVLYPVYKGTYERRVGLAVGEVNREVATQWSKDLGRSIDYLQSRNDIDSANIGYFGQSMGARIGVMLLALEPRLKAAVFTEGGLGFQRRLPEYDELNFAPRIQIPLLMLNGRYDYIFPPDSSQKHLFRLIGTPEKDKRYVVYDTTHDVLVNRGPAIREILDWLDRYLGPVKNSGK